MDRITKETRSKIMSQIRSENTKVEQLVYRELHRRKVYYQKHYKGIPGSPDIAVPSKKRVVLIDGDFWHGRELRKLKERLPDGYWIKKIERNVQRDRKNRAEIRKDGWEILRFWESDIYEDLDGTVDSIVCFLSRKTKKKSKKGINWKRAYEIVWANLILEEAGAEPRGLVGFEFDGYWIIDPFADETGVEDVEPLEYYGEAFIGSLFANPRPRAVQYLSNKR